MLIGTHQKLSRTQSKLNISIRGEHLDNVDQFKYLGFGLIPSLSWSFHIDKLVSKINQRIGLLRRVRILPKATLNLLFKSLILPHFDYCDVVWGNTGTSHLSRLNKLQNTAGKVILGLPRRFPTDVLLEMLDWKRLSDRRSTYLNILVYKILTHKLPLNMCNIFNYVSGSHENSTRAGSQGNLMQKINQIKENLCQGGWFLSIICLSRPNNHFLLVFLLKTECILR